MQSALYKNLKSFFQLRKPFLTISSMSTHTLRKDANSIFEAAYSSVQPENLFQKEIKVQSNKLEIQGKTFPLSDRVYIVGFGKAVLGMAKALEEKLKSHLISGIISIPEGMLASAAAKGYKADPDSCIQIYEGAANNSPDENSLLAATKIKELVTGLEEADLLIVLISGGGSALLPSPTPPLTLLEKQKAISVLASNGACIEELYAVRKQLSLLKGGKLALLAKPAKVISLILSDIVGDPLNLIASAPTVRDDVHPDSVVSIFEKYDVMHKIPQPVLKILEEASKNHTYEKEESFSHVSNFIIGNNRIALNAASQTAGDLDYTPFMVTSELRGTASTAGKNLIAFVSAALQGDLDLCNKIGSELSLPSQKTVDVFNSINDSMRQRKKLCLLFGGETTVKVQGTGTGGRNQELALAAALELHARHLTYSILLLSAGTDGIDGPTDAAGAVASILTIAEAEKQHLDAAEFIENNDSYNFYSKLTDGYWLVKTGHTGTNVMDVIIILIC